MSKRLIFEYKNYMINHFLVLSQSWPNIVPNSWEDSVLHAKAAPKLLQIGAHGPRKDASALHFARISGEMDRRHGIGKKNFILRHYERHNAYQLDRLRSEMISDGIRLTPQLSGHPPSEIEFSVFNLRFIFMVKFMDVPPSGLVGGT